ncbi:MAG: hypothetical protein NUW01_02035, partial [Gemmatimonadaceae bacterium]|nr:hypothetical protein [Gemmatimonadaceae bacterium]
MKLRMKDQASTNGVMIDYSGNGHHGGYGGVKKAAILDTVYGDRGLILPGIAGNYASTPDAAALRITSG